MVLNMDLPKKVKKYKMLNRLNVFVGKCPYAKQNGDNLLII